VLNTLWNNCHLAWPKDDEAVAKVDPQLAVDHDERFIGVGMVVPDEVAFQANDLELVIVQLGDDPWSPLLRKLVELGSDIDDGDGAFRR